MIYESKIARLKFNLKTLKLIKAATGKDPLQILALDRDVVDSIEFAEVVYDAGCRSNGTEPEPGFDDLSLKEVADIIDAFVKAYTYSVPGEVNEDTQPGQAGAA